MNRTKTLAVALLIAALPFASATYASERGHDNRGQGRPEHARGHDAGHDRHGYRGHHGRHHYRHNHHNRHHNVGHSGHGARVALPFPPLPPFPVIVLNKKHHNGHAELRHLR